jgi:hypothetical protein
MPGTWPALRPAAVDGSFYQAAKFPSNAARRFRTVPRWVFGKHSGDFWGYPKVHDIGNSGKDEVTIDTRDPVR